VDSVQVVRPDDVHVLAPSDQASLTLVTCYPFHFVGPAPKRYIVHAQLIEPSPAAQQGHCQTQNGPASDGSAEGYPSAATVPPSSGPSPDRPSSDDRAESSAARIGEGLATGGNGVLYQVKMTLRDIYPPIWRRIQLWENETFTELRRERDRLNARVAAALESYMNGDD
jgi:hypothetical protein